MFYSVCGKYVFFLRVGSARAHDAYCATTAKPSLGCRRVQLDELACIVIGAGPTYDSHIYLSHKFLASRENYLAMEALSPHSPRTSLSRNHGRWSISLTAVRAECKHPCLCIASIAV